MTNLDATRRQYAKNAVGLRQMLAKAQAVAPRKVNGYTVAELAESVALYDRLAAADDTALLEWLSPAALSARIAEVRARRFPASV